MFGTMGRADSANMQSCDPDNIAAVFILAFGLEHVSFLFLPAIRRPAIVSPAFDVETSVGQRTESYREIIEALLQQFSRHGMNHLALQPDFDRRRPILLAVLGIDRHHGMNQFVDENAENSGRLIDISADEYLEMLIR